MIRLKFKHCITALLTETLILGTSPVGADERVGPPQRLAKETPSFASDSGAATREKIISPIPAFAMLATGGVMLVTGIVTGALALKVNGDLNDNCPEGYCLPAYHDDVDRLDALTAVTDAVIPVSIGVLISGAFLLVLHKKTARRYGGADTKGDRSTRLVLTGRSVGWRF
jgi:hypothetical protein